jgi:alpha-galactosidase
MRILHLPVARSRRASAVLAALVALAVPATAAAPAAAAPGHQTVPGRPATSAAVPATTPAAGTTQACTPDGLACTPYMGWNTYYGLGGSYDEATVENVADSLVSSGLAAAGYKIVWLDAGWWSGSRDANGNITVSSAQWPGGMSAFTSYIHSKGLLAGIYTDAGSNGCAGQGEGSYGHYQQDVDTFASWGFDAVKVDFCGGTQLQLDPEQAYSQFSQAIANDSPHRPMIFNICNPFEPGEYGNGYPSYDRSVYNSYSFGPGIANSWRTDTDVGFVHSIAFSDVLRNLDADAAHPEAAGPGHWNDPDYLGPELGMTPAEFQAQLSMWSMEAAPLIIGSDVRTLSASSIGSLTNREILAIDQDPAGQQATVLANEGSGQVWVKTLSNGDRAVALLNRGSTPLVLSTTASDIGLPSASAYNLRDVWQHATTETAGRIAADVPPDSVVVYRVSAGNAGQGQPPAVVTSGPGTPGPYSGSQLRLAIPASALPVTASVQNDGRTPIMNASLTLSTPAGWTVSPSATYQAGTVATGQSADTTWSVTPPAGTLPGTYTLTVRTRYSWAGAAAGTADVPSAATVTVPVTPPSGTGYLSNHIWLDATSGYLVPRLDAEVGGQPMHIDGTYYPRGVGTASVSAIDYYLGGDCSTVSAVLGIDDVARQVSSSGGTAEFEVFADGQEIYDSGLVTQSTAPADMNLNVSGAKVLTLYVGDGGDGTYNDRADWADLQASCGSAPATVPAGTWPDYVPASSETATASSSNDGYPPSNAIDGQLTTIWHSEFSPVQQPLPVTFTIEVGAARTVDGLVYQPRLDQAGGTGTITGYTVAVSTDGTSWQDVATGSWDPDGSVKSASFAPVTARYLQITITSGLYGYASAAEFWVSDVPAPEATLVPHPQ